MEISFLDFSLVGEDVPEYPPKQPESFQWRVLAAIGIKATGSGVEHARRAVSDPPNLTFQFGDESRRSQRDVSCGSSLLAQGVKERLDLQWLQTFKEIDTNNTGRINADDLHAFALKNGMPTDYVDVFISSVLAVSSESKQFEARMRKGVDFDSFRTYVSSRECALRRAFDLFDLDGDGKITPLDLQHSLTHVRVKCPYSRCVYQSRPNSVKGLLAKVDLDGNETVEFNEFRRFFMLLPSNGMAVDYWLSAECCSRCDVGGCVVVHDEKSKGSPWGHLFAGAVAGAASRTATAPLETLRLSAMTGSFSSDLGTMAVARAVVERQGWKALYKGNLTNVIRSAPQKALDFFAFDAFKGFLGGSGSPGTLQTFVAAGLAGGASNAILYPLEVVRSRLTIDSTGAYKGAADAFSKIVKSEGVPALYKGVGPSVAAILPEAAIVYGLFDILKKSYSRISGKDPGITQSLTFGVFSAFMGQVVAYPLETVSRRMQVCGVNASGRSHNFATMLNEVVSEGGPGALYRGIGPASLKVVPMAIVSFGTYELVRLWVNELEDKADARKAQQEQCNLCGKKAEEIENRFSIGSNP
ncbi:hypothetical protein BSKO_04818 [Bryopsis sp. KO-2023]|nr:hypothetical protein BSKO_04818 [Bryopsis sp. KO-2023]